MATKKKMLLSSAGTAAAGGGGGLDIDEVFSTYLYDGTGAAQTITNGIDLDGEGGLVWIKAREGTYNQEYSLIDTERGPETALMSSTTGANSAQQYSLGTGGSFNSNGFTIASTNNQVNGGTLADAGPYVSWTFRKAPKFFDVVTYTGNGVSGRTISHNLGSVPGMIIIKGLDTAFSWQVFHRSLPTETGDFPYTLRLDTNAAQGGSQTYYGSGITSTEFKINSYNAVNQANKEYVAYIFAHNDGDGTFGPDGDQDIIKCGTATTPSSAVDLEIDLGFEPQYVMYKLSATAGSWQVHDNMRSLHLDDSDQPTLYWNQSYPETQITSNNHINPTSTGFRLTANAVGQALGTNAEFIYMAIRRGPLAVPEDATKVFALDNSRSSQANANGVAYYSGFPVDMSLFSGSRSGGGNHDVRSRLTGTGRMFSNATTAEVFIGNPIWDTMHGWKPVTSTGTLNTDVLTYMWKRAPGHFDAVAYTGNGFGEKSYAHNLGVVPELMIVKNRQNGTTPWAVYHKDLGNTDYLQLQSSAGASSLSTAWANVTPTETVFTVGSSSLTNQDLSGHIAYLFASAPGVSKVGSISHTNGTASNVDCGFSNGARWVLVKRSDGTGNWFVWDSVRGIVSGADKRLYLNGTAAENTGNDDIDPYAAGFTWVSTWSTGSYIFYAIA